MDKLLLRLLFFLVTALFFQFNGYATHIVGGDIFIRWTGTDNRYQIILNKYVNERGYYQEIYGPDAIETVTLEFSNGNNTTVIRTEYLALISNTLLVNNNNYCVNSTIVKTSLQVYQSVVTLNEFNTNDACKVSWVQCCRSSDITNIAKLYSSSSNSYSQEQEIFLFTTKYEGKIKNTTPFFKRLNNEYFCLDALNTFDMSAADAEGDSLVYSLVSPQESNGRNVQWLSGYSGNSPVPGTVPMRIDKHTGQMIFNPSQSGTFLFGIRVLEYRNNILLSEVRKDFQFNVQSCAPNNKPVIDFGNTPLHTGAVIEVPVKGESCIPIYITDVDASQFGRSEFINVRTTSDFPSGKWNFINQLTLNPVDDTIGSNLCINPCLMEQLKATTDFNFHIIINDIRCPAQYDTLDFIVKVIVPQNAVPEVFISPSLNPQVVRVDSLLTFDVFGTDADPVDVLSLTIQNAQRSMNFKNVFDSTSTIRSTFSWIPNCNDLYPGIYDIYFLINDNSCIYGHADTVQQRIVIFENEVSFAGMEITNLVTPNGDGLNDFYQVPDIPVGNCSKYFKGIEIYNRWGSRVYYSQDRFFQWFPKESDGIYYYSIDLNDEVKKGWIQVTR